MDYAKWQRAVPAIIKKEPIWSFYGYRKALFLHDLTWNDCDYLTRCLKGKPIANQLIRSVGSISANIEEGHGRGFQGKERKQFLRYALASARETKGWYFRGRHALPDTIVNLRLKLVDEIISLLVTELSKPKTH